ncbi:MAG TPA: hypothetical protein ENG59_07615 [Chloroflexi bacterium]|nr:hypothetical protein [Chloroflexota bacterium]
MKIPKHVKYLSILFFLNAGISALIGGLSLYSMLRRRETLSDLSPEVTIMGWDLGLSILLTLLAILLLIALGISLRKLKPWARSVTLAYGVVTILLGLLNLITGDRNTSYGYGFLIQFYAVWVLLRPDVKEAFNVRLKKRDGPLQDNSN